MKKRFAQLATIATIGALVLTACSSGGEEITSDTTPSGNGSSTSYACPTGNLVGGGSTAQKLAMDTLISDYSSACKNAATIEYSGTGSGAGIKDFYNSQIDWAGSDSALKSEANKDNVIETDKAAARCGADAWNLPLVISPVAFAFNLEGVDSLVLTADVINQIAFGKITNWNDSAIAELNPGATLPDLAISVFFRSDESGTTENVTKFLSAAAADSFTGETGKSWPGTVGEGKKGTQGVADGVATTAGGFGYMEWKYATDSALGVASIDNGNGAVELTADTVAAGVEGATVTGEGNDLKLELEYADTAAGAYPAVMVTYEIVCSSGLASDKSALLKDFLSFAVSEDEQAVLVENGYGPLPETLRTKVVAAIEAIA